MSAADLMPEPVMWPECSECGAAYVMRRGLSLSKGWLWHWARDCKHKKAEPIIANADGPLPVDETGAAFLPEAQP